MGAMIRDVGLVSYAILTCLPFGWLVFTAFRPRLLVTESPPHVSGPLTLGNFALIYNGQSVLELLGHSLVVAMAAATLTVVIGAPAAYYFARRRSSASKALFFFVLSTRMAPPLALSLPMFVLFTTLGMRGTLAAVVVAHIALNLAFVVWFLEPFFAGVPPEVERAAQVDGRTLLGALTSVVLPVVTPALTAALAFVFLFSWNEYLLASLLGSSTTRLLTPALPGFIAQATSQWGQFCAVALLGSLPAVLMVLLGRRFLARAVTVGMITDD